MRTTRLVVTAGVTAAMLILGMQAASAHVTIPGPAGTKGANDVVISFSVPNERDDATTTEVEVQMPSDATIPSVIPQSKPGWAITTTMRKLDAPIETDDGTVTEAVDTVTWTGGSIEPGQFDLFSLAVGPLPTTVDELAFPTVQTYSDGQEVRWVDPTLASGDEPEHPAPVFELVAADTATTATSSDDPDAGSGLAVAAAIISVLALAVGLGAVATARRSRA